jgi:signal transduction histidine kinase
VEGKRLGRREVAALVLILVFTVFGAIPVQANPAEVAASKRLVKVAADNAFPPYEYVSSHGILKGFNVDIIQAVALQVGWDLEFVPLPWPQALEALEKGKVDAIQGMKYTPERDEHYDFSVSYLQSSQAIFVHRDRQNIHELADLSDCSVAVQEGSIGAELVKNVPKIKLLQVPSQGDALQLLLENRVEAVVSNHLTGLYNLQVMGRAKDVKTVGELLDRTDYALAVVQGENRTIIEEFNTGLAAIRKNGTYEKIYHKWFGVLVPDYSTKLRQALYVAGTTSTVLILIIAVVVRINQRLRAQIQRQAELLARRERLESVGEVAASLAHEIRNPLTAIKTFVELMPEKLDNPLFRTKLLEIVPEEVSRLDLLLTSVLDYARPRLPVRQDFVLLELVQEVEDLLEQQAVKKDLVLTTVVPPALMVSADREQIRQILFNIMLNAIQVLPPEGSINLQAKAGENLVDISCQDSGPGVNQEDLTRIFDPFFTRRKKGTGLGLFLSYRLAQENRGELVAESPPGEGLKITLYLPLGGQISGCNFDC